MQVERVGHYMPTLLELFVDDVVVSGVDLLDLDVPIAPFHGNMLAEEELQSFVGMEPKSMLRVVEMARSRDGRANGPRLLVGNSDRSAGHGQLAAVRHGARQPAGTLLRTKRGRASPAHCGGQHGDNQKSPWI